jgi:hypothetical protein
MSRFASFSQSLTNLLHVPRYLKTPFLLTILASAIISFTTLVMYFTIQPELPIFYSLSQPQEYLVRKEWIFLFAVLSWLATFVHLVLLPGVRKYERVIQQLFGWAAVIFQFLLGLALFRILVITF